jgi:hypothetical protein
MAFSSQFRSFLIFAGSFTVDGFLSRKTASVGLERLRDDLGVYLKVLRSAMIELINEDYAGF